MQGSDTPRSQGAPNGDPTRPDGSPPPGGGSADGATPATGWGSPEWAEAEAEADQPDRLSLEEPASLPWLESDDDDGEDESHGTGQLVGLLLLGAAALALIVGGIWWVTRKNADSELVADGSVIEAPAEPYKQRPEKPGGMTFEGTGDTSFAVSQGQSRPARLGDDAEASPQPGFASVDQAAASRDTAAGVAAKPAPAASGKSAAPAPATTSDAPVVAGVGVQVGAYSTRALAEAGWARLSQGSEALSGVRHRIVEGRADIGTVFRLQAVTPDAAAARALCARLKSSGVACQVKN